MCNLISVLYQIFEIFIRCNLKYGTTVYIQYFDFSIKVITANQSLAMEFVNESANKCVGQCYAQLFKTDGESAVDKLFTKQIQCITVVIDENVRDTDVDGFWKEISLDLTHLKDYIKECEKEDDENMAK